MKSAKVRHRRANLLLPFITANFAAVLPTKPVTTTMMASAIVLRHLAGCTRWTLIAASPMERDGSTCSSARCLLVIRPTVDQVRRWSDDLLDDHLKNCFPGSGYICPGCAKLNRDAFEAQAVADGVVTAELADGWL
jgi:hypothetical protein